MLAKTIPISLKCHVPMGEALTLYYAMQWLSDMSFNNVDFTSDSKVTIDAFHQAQVDVTKIVKLDPCVDICSLHNLQTRRASSIDDKQMR